MSDKMVLREKAREAIQNGKLPTQRPHRMFGGPGSNAPCGVCGKLVPHAQMEYEIEFHRSPGGEPALERYYFHPLCFAAWEFARKNPEAVLNPRS